MDIFRMDTPTGEPQDLVTGERSFIWTERYTGENEFEFTSPLIEESKDALPIDSFLTLLDSREVMWIEEHLEEKNDEGEEIVKITGRSFAQVLLEKRAVKGLRGGSWAIPPDHVSGGGTYSPDTAAGILVWEGVVAPLDVDLIGSPVVSDIFEMEQAEGVPGITLTDSSRAFDSETWKRYFVQPGDMWTQMQNFMSDGPIGFRIVRAPFFKKTLTYSTTGVRDINGPWLGESGLAFDLYTGQDLSEDVVFDYQLGDFDSGKRLKTSRRHFNVAYVLGSNTAADDVYVYADGVSESTGLSYARRVMVVDAGINQINRNEDTGEDVIIPLETYKEMLRQAGRIALRKQRPGTYFEGEVSRLARWKYGEDYNLGDIVTVRDRSGSETRVRVVEYVRTQDETGDYGFPTFSAVDVDEEA